jgi:hypothetical protein
MTSEERRREGAYELVRAVREYRPYAAGKLGTSEYNALQWYITHRKGTITPKQYPRIVLTHMVVNAGLFPARPDILDSWCEHMICEVLPSMDYMVEWLHETRFLNIYAPTSKRGVLRSLEPYYESDSANRYTLSISKTAKIAIISPFADSIALQIPKLPTLWSTCPIWPIDAHFIPIKTYFSPLVASETTSWPTDVDDWMAARDHIVKQVQESGTQYVFIGCGALSLPIAVALKRIGCIVFHTGGATQIMFGIKGGRWDTHSIISGFYNEYWIRPAVHEIPTRSDAIERGCYF